MQTTYNFLFNILDIITIIWDFSHCFIINKCVFAFFSNVHWCLVPAGRKSGSRRVYRTTLSRVKVDAAALLGAFPQGATAEIVKALSSGLLVFTNVIDVVFEERTHHSTGAFL